MRRIRVCMVAPSRDILGGQAVQAERLFTHLREAPDLELEFLPINPRLPGMLRRLQDVKYVRTLATESAYVASLAVRLRHCDIVHVFSASYLSFLLAPTPAILLARIYNKPVIVNYRSGEAEDHLHRWRSAVATLRLADRIVVPSGYLVEVFRRFDLKAEAVQNIVSLERFKFRRRQPLRPRFFANRNLEPLYDVACVIRAFGRVQAEFPDATLVIAGDGSLRSQLEQLVIDLRLRHVRFIGLVPPEQMAQYYDEADIYLNASRIDNMPTSLIEAFAAGLPIVSTDAGGIPYVVRDGINGVLVAAGDDAAMAAACLRLLADSDWAGSLVRNAHEECRSRYQWQSVRENWIQLYTSLVQKPVRGRQPPAHNALPAVSE